jgi:hypothetical protein
MNTHYKLTYIPQYKLNTNKSIYVKNINYLLSNKLISYDDNILNKKYSNIIFSLSNNILFNFISNKLDKLSISIQKKILLFDEIQINHLYTNTIKYFSKNISEICVISKNPSMCEFLTYFNYKPIYYKLNANGNKILRSGKNIQNLSKKYIQQHNIKIYNYDIGKIYNISYKFIIYDIFTSYYYKIYDKLYVDVLQIIKQREYINCILLDELYKLLDNLENNGDLMFYYPLISNNCSALLIETIFNCFTKIIVLSDRQHGFIWGNIYICKGYKGKQNKLKNNTQHFYDFIQKLNKKNDKNNKNILLNRQYVDILLKHNPQSHELESRYLVYRHTCFLMMQKYKIETIKEPIEKKITNIFKLIVSRTNNYSRKVNVRCSTVYPPNEPETQEICNHDYDGILYDIFIHVPTKKDVKKVIPYNKMYIKAKEKAEKSKYYKQIIKYVGKTNTNDSIKLFLSNVDFRKRDILLYTDDDKAFEKSIKAYLNDNNIKHIYNDNYDKKIRKCVITNVCNISDREFYKNVLKSVKALNNDDELIIKLSLPITTKLVLDLIYILYCSFKTIYVDYPKSFDKCIYIYFVKHKKNISIKSFEKLDINEDLIGKSIIPDPFINEFKDEFIDVINNFLCTILLQNELISHMSENWNILDYNKLA